PSSHGTATTARPSGSSVTRLRLGKTFPQAGRRLLMGGFLPDSGGCPLGWRGAHSDSRWATPHLDRQTSNSLGNRPARGQLPSRGGNAMSTHQLWPDPVTDPPCEASRLITARYGSLDGQLVSLRWVYLHMIEETAQHRGHLDLLTDAIAQARPRR